MSHAYFAVLFFCIALCIALCAVVVILIAKQMQGRQKVLKYVFIAMISIAAGFIMASACFGIDALTDRFISRQHVAFFELVTIILSAGTTIAFFIDMARKMM